MITSIPGFTADEIAHLSQPQRERLLAERQGGQKAAADHLAARNYDEKQRERMVQNEEDRELLDAEALIARRTAERKLAAERAERQQEVNIRANAEKEASDHNEMVEGRDTIPASVREHVADAAHDLVEQRTEQAKEIGLTAGSTFIGHPDASEGQAAAIQANSEKEVADREQAANYSASDTYQGATGNTQVGIKLALFDDEGNLIEPDEQAQSDAQTTAETGAENNGQADQTSEPNADEIALTGIAADPKPKRRGGKQVGGQTVLGDGPVSE